MTFDLWASESLRMLNDEQEPDQSHVPGLSRSFDVTFDLKTFFDLTESSAFSGFISSLMEAEE